MWCHRCGITWHTCGITWIFGFWMPTWRCKSYANNPIIKSSDLLNVNKKDRIENLENGLERTWTEFLSSSEIALQCLDHFKWLLFSVLTLGLPVLNICEVHFSVYRMISFNMAYKTSLVYPWSTPAPSCSESQETPSCLQVKGRGTPWTGHLDSSPVHYRVTHVQ